LSYKTAGVDENQQKGRRRSGEEFAASKGTVFRTVLPKLPLRLSRVPDEVQHAEILTAGP